MSYKQRDLKILWAHSGGICAYPNCHQELIIRETNDIIGNICHIIAKSADGPRGNNRVPIEKLNSFLNLILLCPNHHTLIDLNPNKYTKEVLIEMKSKHEKKIDKVLNNNSNWDLNVDQFYYLNIPRISILTINNGFYVENEWLKNVEYLHDLGFELTTVMLKYKEIIKRLRIHALRLESFNINDDSRLEGMIFEFDDKFRTKNVPRLDELSNFKMIGDLKHDPTIYKKTNKYNLILTIDPRWLLTTTSFVHFRNSWGSFAGVFMVKQVIKSSKTIIGTPFFIGTPRNELLESIFGRF